MLKEIVFIVDTSRHHHGFGTEVNNLNMQDLGRKFTSS